MIRVGINGFGRIGRSVFRILAGRPNVEVVGINDLFDADRLAYLLRYDTVQGVFDQPVEVTGNGLRVGGSDIRLSAERDPSRLPWTDLDVDIAVESTGVFRTRAQVAQHLDAGAPRVVLTVPAKDEIDAMIVLGVNDGDLGPEHRVVSNASCTTNCLAPLAKTLDDAFGFEEGFITTVHAYTNGQRLVDSPHSDPRRSRSATANIIPTTTGAARAVGKVLPHLNGKLDGMAMRVPVADGSIVDLTCRLRGAPSAEDVNAAASSAAESNLAGILQYSEDPLVSSDILGNPHSSIFDAPLTRVSPAEGGGVYARVVSWYDNEWGYSNRVADLIERLAQFES